MGTGQAACSPTDSGRTLGEAQAKPSDHRIGPGVLRGDSAPADSRLPILRVLWCGLIICAVKIALRIRGFRWTLDWTRRHSADVPETLDDAAEAVRVTERAVAMAGAIYPGRALCLEQSLVVYLLLRRQGVHVEFCHGVQPHPFEAHVWIEYKGEPINDVREHTKRFARLPEQPR